MTGAKTSPHHRVFKVETSFEMKTRQPGGIGRSDAVAAAEDGIHAMRWMIEKTLDEKLTVLETALPKIDAAHSDLREKLREMHDLAVILRDLGGVVGFNLVTYVAESLCKILYLYESRGGFDKAIVDCHVKTIRLVRGESYHKLDIGDVGELKAGLDGLLQKVSALHSY